MKDLITEARELCAAATPGPFAVDYELDGNGPHEIRAGGKVIAKVDFDKNAEMFARSRTLIPELCDALEKAEEQNKQLIREVSALAAESVKRDVALARLEAEVGVALGKGCDFCGLIYAIHAESYGIEDLDCANEPIDNKFCPMCGKRLEVHHDNTQTET